MCDKNPILDPLNGNGATPRFTEEQLKVIEQWFEENAEPLMVVNDGPPINVINVEKFTQFLSLKMFHIRDYHYPSNSEIIEDLVKLRTKKLMNKDIFLYMLDKYKKVPDIKHELNLAFEVFDTEKKSYLDIDELKTMVTTYDQKFDPTELREFLRDANVKGTGLVDYKEFIDRIFAICPDLTNLEPKLFLYENPEDDPSVEKPPPPEEYNFMSKFLNGEGVTKDKIPAEAETVLTEGTTEIKQPIQNPTFKEQNDQAKSETGEPVAAVIPEESDLVVKTEKPLESVKNDDQGYDADVDDVRVPFISNK